MVEISVSAKTNMIAGLIIENSSQNQPSNPPFYLLKSSY